MTRRAAEVVFSGREQPIPCVIFDISSGGARLAIGRSSEAVVRNFTLVLYKDRSAMRDCEVVWLDRRYVGVKFVSDWYTPIRTEQRSDTGDAPG
jgi:PilZ domain-containing protein